MIDLLSPLIGSKMIQSIRYLICVLIIFANFGRGGGKFLPTTWTTYPRYPMTNRVKENLEIQPFLLHFRTPRYLLKFLKNFGKILYDYKYRFVRLLVCPSVSLLSMSKWLIFDTNRHEQTLKIDINHNKNH